MEMGDETFKNMQLGAPYYTVSKSNYQLLYKWVMNTIAKN